ncbi:hypothetical protein ASPSYDRAFT_417084 [Aspergillus sydowii CBS 593.65]|uniref:Uncharacterized protein n=1 Tax=Aspergillus sydowii CBS 593.65 TaxID=1036612 RepID=A0A1L9T8J6_9EURO|nr:uncharacterized protein ASPSYDRAFT_417084 [Aspergillus sydowii CBS 593.65]OJJ55613.1 hypothetical protein ASPSYDRAFT_417084 [Aspergillus sydowii CBS 593.65]
MRPILARYGRLERGLIDRVSHQGSAGNQSSALCHQRAEDKVSKNRGRQTSDLRSKRSERSERSERISTLEGESGTLFGDIESRLGFFIRRSQGGSGRGDADCGRCRSSTPLQLLITRSYQSSTSSSSPHFPGMRHLRASRDPSPMALYFRQPRIPRLLLSCRWPNQRQRRPQPQARCPFWAVTCLL